MERTPVQSSAVKSVAFDPATGLLEVEFPSGYVYHYEGLTAQDHADLLAADSIGRHMNVLKAKASAMRRVSEPQRDVVLDDGTAVR